ncbi:hypothetical protein Bca101_011124 [Brassica carinata]
MYFSWKVTSIFFLRVSELIPASKDGTIRRKSGRQVLFELLAKGGTAQGMIKEKKTWFRGVYSAFEYNYG